MKKILSGIILAGASCAVFATDARVETMGRNSNFFRDEIQIHQNPANLGLHGNIMYGSYGGFNEGLRRPEFPYFGGVVSFGEQGSSRFSIGATFNRVDSALNVIAGNLDSLGLRTTVPSQTNNGRPLVFAGNSWNWPSQTVTNTELDWLGKVDLMTAYTLSGGATIGLGAYFAFQNGQRRDLVTGMESMDRSAKELQNRFVRGSIGVNTPIGDGTDLEASVGISALTLRGAAPGNDPTFFYAADNDIGVQLGVRFFSDMASINGALVPSLNFSLFNYGKDDKIADVSAGIGLNVNIDRGFFWTGFEGVYNRTTNIVVGSNRVENDQNVPFTAGGNYNDIIFGRRELMGGRVGFGIERNVLTDWFVIRVGGGKLLARERVDSETSKWVETPDEDHVSLGMGVNVENRLKIDFTVSENLPYTFTNLFSGHASHIVTRVSAVFLF